MRAPTEASVTWAQALAWRMERQLLDPVGSERVAGVVRRLGAVLSMDDSLAELAVRVRRTASQPGELAAALEEGEVIQAYRLAPSDWPDFRAAVRAALSGGPLTIPELGQELARHRSYEHLRPVFDEGAVTLVKPLTWQGDVCLGPRRDGRRTLQRLDANPRWRGVPDLDAAGPRAVTAYFRTYGPATLDHLHYWLGSSLSVGRKRLMTWVGELGDRLVAVDVEGADAYVAREDMERLLGARPSEAVRFLPGHDQWVMGPGTKDGHVTPPSRRGLMTRKANPVIAGGVVCGTWTRTGDDLAVTWLDARLPAQEAIEREADRLAGILGRNLNLRVTS